jgi:hypothetical protein
VGREYFPNKWSTYVLLPGNNFGYYRRVEMMMKVRISENIFYFIVAIFVLLRSNWASLNLLLFFLLSGLVKNAMLLNY